MSRWIRFIIAIAVGLALGLLYGWVLSPVEYVDTSPDTLRIDYQSDYVLMVAEIFQTEGDPILAQQRLAFLSSMPVGFTIQKALDYAEQKDFYQADVALLRILRDDAQVNSLPVDTP